MTKLTPARIVPPGRILSREIEARGWTQQDLAEIMNRPPQTISAIINAKKEIIPETAIELSQALGTTPEVWLNLEKNYRLYLAKKKYENDSIVRRSRLYEIAPIKELIKREWLPSGVSLEELERATCEFLGISSTAEKPELAVNFRHNNNLSPEKIALISWAKRVEYLVKNKPIGNFNQEKLQTSMAEILSYAQNEADIAKIPPLLMSLGIYFLIVPHLPKTYLDGATFLLNNNPVIALTLRYNRIDSFWFTLMHELAHIVLGHKGIYFDNLQDLENNSEEEKADKLSCDWLINRNALESFVNERKSKFSHKAIMKFAESQKRHPGIIVGRLQYERRMPYKNHRKYLIKVNQFLEQWKDK
jgi:HTH-type transcriptional regulator/antitoxin HigA